MRLFFLLAAPAVMLLFAVLTMSAGVSPLVGIGLALLIAVTSWRWRSSLKSDMTMNRISADDPTGARALLVRMVNFARMSSSPPQSAPA